VIDKKQEQRQKQQKQMSDEKIVLFCTVDSLTIKKKNILKVLKCACQNVCVGSREVDWRIMEKLSKRPKKPDTEDKNLIPEFIVEIVPEEYYKKGQFVLMGKFMKRRARALAAGNKIVGVMSYIVHNYDLSENFEKRLWRMTDKLLPELVEAIHVDVVMVFQYIKDLKFNLPYALAKPQKWVVPDLTRIRFAIK